MARRPSRPVAVAQMKVERGKRDPESLAAGTRLSGIHLERLRKAASLRTPEVAVRVLSQDHEAQPFRP